MPPHHNCSSHVTPFISQLKLLSTSCVTRTFVGDIILIYAMWYFLAWILLSFYVFLTLLHPHFFSFFKRYTCYRRQQNFVAWSYYAGDSNPGLVAEVCTIVCICGMIRCISVCCIRKYLQERMSKTTGRHKCVCVTSWLSNYHLCDI